MVLYLGHWAMGNGQWAMGNGQWAMGTLAVRIKEVKQVRE